MIYFTLHSYTDLESATQLYSLSIRYNCDAEIRRLKQLLEHLSHHLVLTACQTHRDTGMHSSIHRHTQTDTPVHTHTHRQTSTHTDRQTDTPVHTQTDRHTCPITSSLQPVRHTETQACRAVYIDTHRHTSTHTDRQTHLYTQTDRQTHQYTHRQTETAVHKDRGITTVGGNSWCEPSKPVLVA